MNSHRFDWRPRLLRAALIAALLLTASLPIGRLAVPAQAEDDKPPLPSRKTQDEDPPLPSRKRPPVQKMRVEVTAQSAEVQAGDGVVATVRRGEVLPFTKMKGDYYLVIVNGKKGWIEKKAVREGKVPGGSKDLQAVEVPPGPAPAVIDRDTARKVEQATAYL